MKKAERNIFEEHGIMAQPMMAKPMKTLKLHYSMIQILIMLSVTTQ